jgi:hypothetical protein
MQDVNFFFVMISRSYKQNEKPNNFKYLALIKPLHPGSHNVIHQRANNAPISVLISTHVMFIVPRHPLFEEVNISMAHSVKEHIH